MTMLVSTAPGNDVRDVDDNDEDNNNGRAGNPFANFLFENYKEISG